MRLLAPFLLLLALTPSTQAQSPSRVPISAFVEREQFKKPRLSPDGKLLAVAVRMTDPKRDYYGIGVYTLPERKQVSMTRLPIFEVPLNFHWVSNTRLIVTKGVEEGSEDVVSNYGEILAMDFDGGRQEYLFGYRMGDLARLRHYADDYAWGIVSDLPRQRNGHFYLQDQRWKSESTALYDIDSVSGARKLLAELPLRSMNFVMQPDETPRFAWGYDVKNQSVLFERDGKGAWRQLPAEGLGEDFAPFAFDKDGRFFYATYSPDGGPAVLVRQELASGKRTVLLQDPQASIGHFQWGPTKESLPFAAAPLRGKAAWHYLDPDSPYAQLHKTLSAAFPGDLVDFLSFSEDGRMLLFGVSSDRDPGSYYLYNRDTGKADLLFASMEKIDPDAMAPRKIVRFKARDGLQLDGILTLPNTAGGRKPALIVMPHGGPIGIYDTWIFDGDAQFLASRGYAVLQVNFRGSGGRGPAFRRAGHREWGGRIQDDLVDAIRWAGQQGEVDGTRVCAFGASFGGYSALMLAAREPSLLKCAVGYAGVYDLPAVRKERRSWVGKQTMNYIGDILGTDDDELRRNSPALLADRITVPVLLAHGAADKIAPVQQAETMRAALTKANRPPEWLLVEGEAHGISNPKNLALFYERLEAFFGRHLGN